MLLVACNGLPFRIGCASRLCWQRPALILPSTNVGRWPAGAISTLPRQMFPGCLFYRGIQLMIIYDAMTFI